MNDNNYDNDRWEYIDKKLALLDDRGFYRKFYKDVVISFMDFSRGVKQQKL